jgi:hypothetical protein
VALSATLTLKEITIGYIAYKVVKNHYGVPGSPVWYEPEDIEVSFVEILGVPVDFADLPLDLQEEMLTLGNEIDINSWES